MTNKRIETDQSIIFTCKDKILFLHVWFEIDKICAGAVFHPPKLVFVCAGVCTCDGTCLQARTGFLFIIQHFHYKF